MARYDVLALGGGPAGSTTAWRLADGGARVLLVDKATFPRDKPCGGGVTMGGVRPCPGGPAPGGKACGRRDHEARRPPVPGRSVAGGRGGRRPRRASLPLRRRRRPAVAR